MLGVLAATADNTTLGQVRREGGGIMTDLSDDTLRLVRAASVANMPKADRADYLRSRGWRKLHGRKQQRWESRNGVKATLAGACQIQALADLERL